jgi:hypothetical protein
MPHRKSSGRADRQQPVVRDAQEHAGDLTALTRGLLEQVLDATEAATQEPAPAAAADLLVLREVARRHAGRPLVVDPILVELVEAMLVSQFKQAGPRDNWTEIARQVAERLFEDPPSEKRLHELWQRLSQGLE